VHGKEEPSKYKGWGVARGFVSIHILGKKGKVR